MTIKKTLAITGLVAALYGADAAPAIIPQPQQIKDTAVEFVLNPGTQIMYSGLGKDTALFAAEALKKSTGFAWNISTSGPHTNVIVFKKSSDSTLGDEGYALSVKENQVEIEALTETGLFYGFQTLRQMLPADIYSKTAVNGTKWVVDGAEVRDVPRFKWRGMHMDVARHFRSAEFVKRFIDLQSIHKMNTFHWHLTEDQGWRIDIKKYPKLREISSMRQETLIGHNRSKPQKFDGKPHGGYYTHEQVKEVVEYARKRHITVIPEIEMPGHSVAALEAYPELGCTGGPYKAWTRWGISDDVYCAGNEKVFEFLEDVLDEVCELFPGEYIHVGGDECKKSKWKKCPKCQARIKDNGLHDEHELQSYFINRMNKYLVKKGKRLIGWEEITEGNLTQDAAVMTWRGWGKVGVQAAKDGHDVVMAPGSNTYFDKYQAKKGEPLAIGGFVPLERVYQFEPVHSSIRGTEAEKRIIGTQAQLWSEYIPTAEHMEYMAFPRECALAEVAWLQPEKKDFTEFQARLGQHLERLKVMDVNYRKLD